MLQFAEIMRRLLQIDTGQADMFVFVGLQQLIERNRLTLDLQEPTSLTVTTQDPFLEHRHIFHIHTTLPYSDPRKQVS